MLLYKHYALCLLLMTPLMTWHDVMWCGVACSALLHSTGNVILYFRTNHGWIILITSKSMHFVVLCCVDKRHRRKFFLTIAGNGIIHATKWFPTRNLESYIHSPMDPRIDNIWRLDAPWRTSVAPHTADETNSINMHLYLYIVEAMNNKRCSWNNTLIVGSFNRTHACIISSRHIHFDHRDHELSWHYNTVESLQ